jgi:hypothetical protein
MNLLYKKIIFNLLFFLSAIFVSAQVPDSATIIKYHISSVQIRADDYVYPRKPSEGGPMYLKNPTETEDTTVEFDANGRELKIKTSLKDDEHDKENSETLFSYDPAGYQIEMKYSYNSTNRLHTDGESASEKITNANFPNYTIEKENYSDADEKTSYYDSTILNNHHLPSREFTFYGDGNKKEYAWKYDSLDRRIFFKSVWTSTDGQTETVISISRITKNGIVFTDDTCVDGYIEHWYMVGKNNSSMTYDPVLEAKSKEKTLVSAENMVSDSNGNLLSDKKWDAKKEELDFFKFTYDSLGNLLSSNEIVKDEDGTDTASRYTDITYSYENQKLVHTLSVYKTDDGITSWEDFREYSQDKNGRKELIYEIFSVNENSYKFDGKKYLINERDYDSKGLLTEITTYDNQNGKRETKTEFTYTFR